MDACNVRGREAPASAFGTIVCLVSRLFVPIDPVPGATWHMGSTSGIESVSRSSGHETFAVVGLRSCVCVCGGEIAPDPVPLQPLCACELGVCSRREWGVAPMNTWRN